MGLGMALMEESHLDVRDGHWVNPDLAEYHIMTAADVPQIDVVWLNHPDAWATPLGVKGPGEIGIVGAAAVANAVFHATGRHVHDLLITLDKLW